MDNTELLIRKLYGTNKANNKRLAKSILRIHESRVFDSKRDGKRLDNNHKKAYRLLLNIIPKEIKDKILELDMHINAIIDLVRRTTGWIYTSRGFVYRDNFHNMQDYEFRSFDTYEVKRGENGFYVEENEFKEKRILDREKIFFKMSEDMLEVLHSHIVKKEMLIRNCVVLAEDQELAESLIIFLGYQEEDNKQYKKEM